jgi:hypothetical protein|nr:MAG TPA: hypothetical protein [Caudoviricetes sp.]
MKVKQVNVASRRSVKVGTEFLTYEVGMVADLEDGENEIESIQELFKTANDQVDTQIEMSVRELQ